VGIIAQEEERHDSVPASFVVVEPSMFAIADMPAPVGAMELPRRKEMRPATPYAPTPSDIQGVSESRRYTGFDSLALEMEVAQVLLVR
jgi:hypothetical protein